MIEQSPAEDSPQRAEMLRVGKALRDIVQGFEESRLLAAKRHHLHPTDFSCIGYLYTQNKAISPKDIGPALSLSPSAVTSLIDRLEHNGYVRRIFRPDDRRSVLIELDHKAASHVIELHVGLQQSYVSVACKYSTAQLGAIADFLEKLNEAALKQYT